MQAQSKAEGWAVKRGTKRYEARWLDVDGIKRRAKTGFTTKRDAEKYAKTQAAEVAGIRSGKIAPDRPETVEALVDIFLEKHGRTVDVATERKLRQQLKHVRTS